MTIPIASMRPRLKAAENSCRPEGEGRGSPPAASMRPRLKAAENESLEDRLLVRRERASMRPRLKAAENEAIGVAPKLRNSCFNEAAA